MNDEPNEQCLLIINKDLDGIIREANIVDPKKFGFSLPEDVPFEDLSNMRSGILCSNSSSSGGSNGAMPSTISQTSGGILKSESKVGMLAAMKLKKLYGVVRVFNAGKVTFRIRNVFRKADKTKKDWFQQPPFHPVVPKKCLSCQNGSASSSGCLVSPLPLWRSQE
ncbi:uncharacterized protein LOC116930755 [Daphnia magna]|uniref:uncharacterized protein LOC116930755 n=1 Tax=Daphnia magna TaxID=35525 RepID=UPI001401FC18|nr:uncharacterized protein LOC116930755 [Daphnia magna]